MPAPRVLIVRAPGTNCDEETARAFVTAGAAADRRHLFRVLEDPDSLDDYQIFCVPGGFSYGDDLGAGVIFARHLTGPLGEAFGRFLNADKLVLGVCNGFQVLLKAGVLPGGANGWGELRTPTATLTWNESGPVRLPVGPPAGRPPGPRLPAGDGRRGTADRPRRGPPRRQRPGGAERVGQRRPRRPPLRPPPRRAAAVVCQTRTRRCPPRTTPTGRSRTSPPSPTRPGKSWA